MRRFKIITSMEKSILVRSIAILFFILSGIFPENIRLKPVNDLDITLVDISAAVSYTHLRAHET